MLAATRIASFNALAIVGLWALITAVTGSWSAQLAGLITLFMFSGAAALVFWRVRQTYMTGNVTLSRAVSEGFFWGGVLTAVIQVGFWVFFLASGYARAAQVIDASSLSNAVVQVALSAALGAVIGAVALGGEYNTCPSRCHLTPPSSGRPRASFAVSRSPLMSNVRSL